MFQHLEAYLKSTLTASYPEILIKHLDRDPLLGYRGFSRTTSSGSLRPCLGKPGAAISAYLPLKTYRDFAETDPLAPVLCPLQIEATDKLLQLVVAQDNERWKTSAPTDGPAADGVGGGCHRLKRADAEET